jgi:hypothetical protein
MQSVCLERFCGQIVGKEQLGDIVEIIETFPKLSRTELANTVCELFSWKRANGKLKSVECLQFLESLEEKGFIKLPVRRQENAKRGQFKVQRSKAADIQPAIFLRLKDLAPIRLRRVESRQQRQLWYEYVDRYHYLGTNCRLERSCAILLNLVRPTISLAVFSFPVRLGRWRPGIGGLAGAMNNERQTCRRLLITAGFFFFPG